MTAKRKAPTRTSATTSSRTGTPASATPATIDAYLARLSQEQRGALERLRTLIHRIIPDAEECISYGVPAFRRGRVIVSFGATARHLAFFLFSGSIVAQFADALARFDTSKGTVRFTPDAPLPDALVRKLVKARLAESEGAA